MTQKEKVIEIENILRKHNWTITCAESCTGGLIASKITEISGSSDIFKGSIVTYCNEIKEQELGVKKETMIKYGVVSIEVVNEMLDGVLNKFNATYAIAVSGVAGPNGGTKDKPIGTVVIGIKNTLGFKRIERFHFEGDRKNIQESSSNKAFEIIFEKLQNL
ncbi:MAG: CinA family protein [Epsilonproteobacteria bacterium]|nr:CinA family protein [Campylobacterota bacterium]